MSDTTSKPEIGPILPVVIPRQAATAALIKPNRPLSPGDPYVEGIIEISRAIFPGAVSVEDMCDPTEPSDLWIVFAVSGSGGIKSILKRELDWHEKVFELTRDRSGKYRLSVYPADES